MLQWLKGFLFIRDRDFLNPDRTILKTSLLRIILLSGAMLTASIVLHSSLIAYQLNLAFIISITVSFLTVLFLTLWFTRKYLLASSISLLAMVIAACISILLFVPDFNLSQAGITFLYTLPLMALFLFGRKVAVIMMFFNVLPFLLLLRNQNIPPIIDIDISLPATHAYLNGLLFVFFNICIPLSAMRLLKTQKVHAQQMIQHQNDLQRTLDQYAEIFENNGTASFFCNEDGVILNLNNAAKEIAGEVTLNRTRLCDIFELTEDTSTNLLAAAFPTHLKNNNSIKYLLQKASLEHHDTLLFHCHDVTEQANHAIELSRLKKHHISTHFYDLVTGLPNENHWYNPAPSTIHLDMTVALVKIDNLSQINAAFGISVGDAILKAFATELKNRFGHHAKIYRFRGASFALEFTSLPLISPENLALQLRERIPTNLQLKHEQQIEYHLECRVGCSSGNKASPQQAAEQCLIAIKQTTQASPVMVYYIGLINNLLEASSQKAKIRDALKHNRLEMWLQPKVRADGHIISFEALARMFDEDGTMIMPNTFIPIIESSQLQAIFAIKVFRQLLQLIRSWPKNVPLVRIAFNLSGQDILSDRFFKVLIQTYMNHPELIPLLEIEITETSVFSTHKETGRRLNTLARMGVSIAIDDFGTGHASLSQLIDISADTIKIDRCFVSQMGISERHTQIVNAAILLAKSLKLNVIAEGIETEAQLLQLTALGCEQFQGYLFGKPAPANLWLKTFQMQTPTHWFANKKSAN
ncbi:GGDEF domain-containing protein [Shewanella baltica]|uniref:GGDEF domain-containing phosphodiesterase n=1 Tax=Shewanella baltica TaxID=62322 RepID=UPI00217D6372|nr:bifunctional diguanylate cyclase/phosphodiesterase [Shewanella baltica]MCS6129526.1 GGDEF domain-containing protein [Shewanella baltica]MCS6141468.1 GGDEF domain-containing protein [Shewanella baltica]MCS6147753.1 GGDEF domain-containing protein [Shewanella baltica]MCS6172282.1 GGDEF domain-containing protein [Shewanella baltica]MCS6189506.1 GGDEF domain-containing protein [Shewanella baltica]